MKKTARNILICAALSVCALSMAAFAACGGSSSSTSLRTQLDAVDPTTVSFDFDKGTFSFTAVENATYYRVYFYNVEEPNEDLDNYDYFVYTTDDGSDSSDETEASAKTGTLVAYADETDGAEEQEEQTQEGDAQEGGNTEYPDAGGDAGGDFTPPDAGGAPDMGGGDFGGGSSVTYNFEKDADGNYVLQDYDTILSQSATYSKRYNAYYYDEETDTKTYYEAGDTVTFTLPNDSISGGRYIIGIKSGGTLALYTLSDWCVVDTNLKLQYVTPEINSGEWSWSWKVSSDTTYYQADGSTAATDYPDGNGMMFELVNADTMYAADPSMELTFYITDSNGNKVDFSYYDLNMTRADSNSLSYWTIANSGTSVQEGMMTLGYSVYSHSGPTMFYAAYGYAYVLGLTVDSSYTFHIQAIAPSTSTTAVSSAEATFDFTYTVQTEGTT
ncbi:MAG: hypothetical protein LUD51_02870 [Clostridia bacterium]|nr:hypothetical protein [Clostridia bacterium]